MDFHPLQLGISVYSRFVSHCYLHVEAVYGLRTACLRLEDLEIAEGYRLVFPLYYYAAEVRCT